MKDLFDILRDFLPLWIVLLILYSGFVVRLHIKYIKNKDKYLKDRIDTVDKATAIFERALERQGQDFENLCKANEGFKLTIEDIKVFYLQRLERLDCISKKLEQQSTRKNKNEVEELKNEISNTFLSIHLYPNAKLMKNIESNEK